LGRKIDATISVNLTVQLPGMGKVLHLETPDGMDVDWHMVNVDVDGEEDAVVNVRFFTGLGTVDLDIDWRDLVDVYRTAEATIETAVLPRKEEAEKDEA